MRFFLPFLFIFLVATSSQAQDRSGLIGQAVVIPIQFQPDNGRGNETYAVDLGYFFTESWLGILSWEFALRGPERINVALGPRYYTRLYSDFKPYVGGEFLYLVDPTNDLGWRAYIGLEYNLHRLTQVDNIRFSLQTGISGISHLDHADDLFYEVVRIGLSWNY